MGGGTEFSSPLSMCHTTITTQATGPGQEAGTKQFCVLISDGAPNEAIGRDKSATIDKFCKTQSLTGTCGTEKVYNWRTGVTNEVPIDCCSSQNIMYRIKKLGYSPTCTLLRPHLPPSRFTQSGQCAIASTCVGTSSLASMWRHPAVFRTSLTVTEKK